MAATNAEINRGYVDRFSRWAAQRRAWSWPSMRSRLLFGTPTRILFLPLVPVAGVAVLAGLRLRLLFKPRTADDGLTQAAVARVPLFAEQYPLHLYPIVAKAYELACVGEYVRASTTENSRIVEVAIGDGVLSALVFGRERRVVGIDLSPYSLMKATRQPHVAEAIVGDGLNPPVAPGSADLLLANNFLHHVTAKSETVKQWGAVAKRLVFNENTQYWASGWFAPYAMRSLGMRGAAQRLADRIEQGNLQCLWPADRLRTMVQQHGTIIEQRSFMSERTFAICAFFSFLLRCYGPPTPAPWRNIAHALGGPVRWLTVKLAQALVEYDAFQDRRRDTFISFYVQPAAQPSRQDGAFLLCPDCRVPLAAADRCGSCSRQYQRREGMLFLLPPELARVETEFHPEAASQLPAQHL
jgi:ubiquinone/menaquinone biosynthesis C-methylase UbiE